MNRILILNPYVATLGGGEKHMGYLCQFFEQYFNHDLTIEILVFNSEDETDVCGNKSISVDSLNQTFGLNLQNTSLKAVKLHEEVDKWTKLKNHKIIKNITKDYDVFVNFMFMSKHIGKARYNIYEVMFPSEKWRSDNILKQLAFKFLNRQFYKSYDVFISNSEFTDIWLKKRWNKISNHTVIYPPVFTEKDSLDGRYNEAKKKNIIISVGRFFVAGHNKKQLEMVRFFVNNQSKLSEVEYHLVGQCSKNEVDIAYLNEIKELAKKVNNVFIHVNSSYSELVELYEQAKIFWHATGYGVDENLHPEQMEHFGITTVEAMSFGVVPVVINKGGQKETVEHEVNGFRWETEAECVSHTVQLLQDDSLRKKMAQKSVQRAKKYSVDEFYRQNKVLLDGFKI